MASSPSPAPGLQAFADAVRPVAAMIEQRIGVVPTPVEPVGNVFELLARHLAVLATETEGLEGDLQSAFDAASDNAVTDIVALRAAARVEVRVERILAGYEEACRSKTRKEDAQGLSLLRAVYVDVLRQIGSSLDDACSFSPTTR